MLFQLRKFISFPTFGTIRRFSFSVCKFSKEFNDRHLDHLIENDEYSSMASVLLQIRTSGHRVFIVQPSMKFKARGRQSTHPELQLAESISLIESLNKWTVVGHGIYTLKTSGWKRYLYGSGNIEKLTEEVRECQATAVFISIDRLSLIQIESLSMKFSLPVYDRYSIVLQIFKNHARSGAAKLQVALAEIPLLRYRKNDSELFKDRERKLRSELEKLEQHRKLIKSRRISIDLPTVAVLGYTNSGKTSLIKALTNDKKLQPENKLFATLDVTAHGTVLPNGLSTIFIDTVGFIADIPTTLIEAFRATLSDAIDAHLLIHICDISHPDVEAQQTTVLKTLDELNVTEEKRRSMITVFNKIDQIDESNSTLKQTENLVHLSCKTGQGLDELIELIERKLLVQSERILCFYRVLQGGKLYEILLGGEYCSIEKMLVDDEEPQFIKLKCYFSKISFGKFQSRFSGAEKYRLKNFD